MLARFDSERAHRAACSVRGPVRYVRCGVPWSGGIDSSPPSSPSPPSPSSPPSPPCPPSPPSPLTASSVTDNNHRNWRAECFVIGTPGEDGHQAGGALQITRPDTLFALRIASAHPRPRVAF